MVRTTSGIALVLSAGCLAYSAEGPAGVLDRFLSRMKDNLNRLPDYVCTQEVERFTRLDSERPWTKVDVLRLDVALVGNRELYAYSGAHRFQDQPLERMVGHGMISSGQFGLLARQVFLSSKARFTYRREIEQNGRPGYEYEYDVPRESSSYRLRVRGSEAAVAFQGVFWVDAGTLDLTRLEVQPYDIPESLSLAEVGITLAYSKTTIGDTGFLLPVSATLTMTTAEGIENLNRTRLIACRRFKAESKIAFEGGVTALPEPTDSGVEFASTGASVKAPGKVLPPGTLLRLVLDSDLDPATAKLGDPVRARIARVVKEGELELVPQGALVLGRVVRLEKELMPFPLYEIGLEFGRIESGELRIALAATMQDAGPASGLIRQSRRLDPTFSARRTPRMDILVREVQRGQGILYWDARRGPLRHGLPMTWRVHGDPLSDSAYCLTLALLCSRGPERRAGDPGRADLAPVCSSMLILIVAFEDAA